MSSPCQPPQQSPVTSHVSLKLLPPHLPLQAMVKHNKLPIAFMKDKPARIGLMPRDATSAEQIQWFELPAFMCFHTAAALEDPETGKVGWLLLAAAMLIVWCCIHGMSSWPY